MDTLMKTVFTGVIAMIIWKVLGILLKYRDLCKKLRHIPQKPSHWLKGNTNEIKDSLAYNNYALDVMKGGGRMYCMWNGPFPILGVCHPETFQQLNKQSHNKARGFTDGYRLLEPWLGEGLLISEGKKWERNRRLLTPAFHFNILNGYVDVMNDVTELFLEKLGEASQGGEVVDVVPYVCRATLDNMLRCSLSYEGSMLESKEHSYLKAVQRLTSLMWERMLQPLLLVDFIFKLSPLGSECRRALEVAHKFTGDLIQSRQNILNGQADLTKQKRRLDFLDILLTAKDEKGNGLSKQEIQDEVDTFTFEGHDTTASAISWSIYALGQHPEFQKKVYEDVQNVVGDEKDISQSCLSQFEYLPLFIKEMMRFYSPVPIVARMTTEPITIDSIEIPHGPRIDINIYAIHHNPEVWKNPETFDPSRFDVAHRDETNIYGFIPFSAGSRNCIGQVFAMNEIKITLAKFVRRFEVLPVKGHTPVFQLDAIMRSQTGLPVVLKPRQQ